MGNRVTAKDNFMVALIVGLIVFVVVVCAFEFIRRLPNWATVLYGACLLYSIFEYITGMDNADNAPKQCVVAAIALVWCILPYTIYKMHHCYISRKNQTRIISLLEEIKHNISQVRD